MRRGLLAVAVLVTLGVLAGCTKDVIPQADLSSRVDVDNPALREAKRQAGVQPCAAGTGSSDLPAVSLPCLGGGTPVDLSTIAGPAVVQLWASWCTSCPHELPLYQRLSEQAGKRLTVVGVDYQDTQPGAALSLLRTTKATFPQVADPGGDLADHYRLTGLPGILLVDGDGKVTFQLKRIETYAQLLALVEAHTGVRVAAG